MSILVQKYGGSSVASEEKIQKVARRVAEAKRAGHDVVVTVSAMGSTTSELLGLANTISNDPAPRELDMLLSSGERISMSLLSLAIQRLGLDCISLTGPQCGIHTSGNHYNASIDEVNPERILEELGRGRVVVAAGYQGVSPDGEVTTLGRGGSDTTAVALAAALDAERCEICSDVDGVYSADPRIVKNARRLDRVGYEEMVAMARHGASVLNPRAVQYAWDHKVVLNARSTFDSQSPGTMIEELPDDAQSRVCGVACHKSLVSVIIRDAVADAHLGDEILDILGKADVFIDRMKDDGKGRQLLISADVIADTDAFAKQLRERFGTRLEIQPRCGSVSAVGLNLGAAEELKHKASDALESGGCRLLNDYNDAHAYTCILPPMQVSRAMNRVHDTFIDTPVNEQEVA